MQVPKSSVLYMHIHKIVNTLSVEGKPLLDYLFQVQSAAMSSQTSFSSSMLCEWPQTLDLFFGTVCIC